MALIIEGMELRSTTKRKLYPDLMKSIASGNLQDVQTSLENVTEPIETYNKALVLASELGHDKIVAVLLRDSRVNPVTSDDSALIRACKNGHTEVVALLLNDRRIDPLYNNFLALYHACIKGYVDTARLFLEDNRVLRANADRDALGYVFVSAAYEGRLAILQLFLDQDVLDVDINHNSAIIAACENGQLDVIRFLLDKKADPSDQNNLSIRLASQNGYAEVVQLLIKDPNVDPTTDDNFPVLSAADHGHTEIIRILLELPAVVANPNIFDEAHKGSFRESINKLILSKEHIDPLLLDELPMGSPKTCFDPIMYNDVDIANEYAAFYIMNESNELLHIGCLDEEALKQYMKNDSLFFACKDHVQTGTLYVGSTDVEPERIRRFAFSFHVYVLDAQARQLRVGNKYILVPSKRELGRIASKEVVDRGVVHIGDVHCGPPYKDKLYTIRRIIDKTGDANIDSKAPANTLSNTQLTHQLAAFGVRRLNSRADMVRELEACRAAVRGGGKMKSLRTKTARRHRKMRRVSVRI